MYCLKLRFIGLRRGLGQLIKFLEEEL
jgi:hypothetical protein